jgi:S1-C subfamily serine protease
VIPRLLVVGLLFALSAPLPAQELRVLHITITVTDADGRDRPVPRHALLVSDNPPTGAPRRVVTSAEGTVDVRLRPGNYTIESDEPLIYQGRSYEWMQILDVPAGRDTALALTPANAQVAASSQAATTMAAGQSSPSELLMTWQGNVVNLWSDTARGAGFVLDRRGLILTNAHVAGASETVEVQFTATRKVAGRVLAADRAKHVAVIWIDPSLVSALPPAKLGYRDGAPALAEGQDIFSIDASLLDQKTLVSGRVVRINGAALETDLRIDDRATGVPILAANGAIIGITSEDDRGQGDAVRIDLAATVLAAAEEKMAGIAAIAATAPTAAPKTTPPNTTALPVEPPPPATDAWKETAPKRLANLGPYQFSTSDFDVTFITPLLNHVLHHRPDYTTGASKPGGKQDLSDVDPSRRGLEDFGNWANYVDAIPPVLIVRATPKLKEKFWTTVGRMAASTQGVALAPFKKMQDSFASMRLYCGQSEITPIHPFRIERRLDNDTGLFEGLYVFDPASLGSQCHEAVKLVLFSEKSPAKGDEHVVDPKSLEQLANDFAAVR